MHRRSCIFKKILGTVKRGNNLENECSFKLHRRISRFFNNNDDEMFMILESFAREYILYIAPKFVERTLNNETRNYDAERDLVGRKNLDTRFSYKRLKRQKALTR